jgi:predicted molibdopterin-dependent oxidoreductase YjgC
VKRSCDIGETAVTTKVTLTIDGRELEAECDSTVLEVCRGAGIHIPTLCHDPRLEPYGACRMCIVQIEGMRGFPTSCTTVVSEGMVVTTQSDELFEMRKTIVELLLSDHNIECMSCDSNGRCGLQDVAYEHNIVTPRFTGQKHVADVDDHNPLIDRDLTKCISCGRCVRICHEVQCCDVYSYTRRGFDSVPNTPFGVDLTQANCEFCGQCVSTCPTGALTRKRSHFRGRAWERVWTETTCSYCAVGCTLTLESKDGVLVGASAPIGKGVNNGNLCVKGRFGYEFVNHPDRLTTPLIRKDGELVEASWDEALTLVLDRLTAIRDEYGPDSIGGRGAARCTNEDNYLFQKFIRAVIGTNNVDNSARL